MGLAKLSHFNQEIDVRFAYLCQFLSVNQVYLHSSKIFFDIYSASIINNICKRFNIPSYIRDIAVLNTGFYFFLNTINYQSSKNIVKFFSKIDAWRKPERIQKLEFLSNFNSLNYYKSDLIYIKKGLSLKKCFLILKNISIKSILKKGFKGHAIKDELMRLRIKKLELWRLKNTEYNSDL